MIFYYIVLYYITLYYIILYYYIRHLVITSFVCLRLHKHYITLVLLLRSVSIEGWSSSHPKLMTVEAGHGPSPLAIAQAPGTAVGLSTCNFVQAIFVDILLALSQHDDSKGVFNKNPEKLMS